jgi:hypothetical protein
MNTAMATMQTGYTHKEAAIYWAAVSLIVCEELSIEKAAQRLNVNTETLREILQQRQTLRLFQMPSPPSPKGGGNVISLFSRA